MLRLTESSTLAAAACWPSMMPPPSTPTLPFKCSFTKDWALVGRLAGAEVVEEAEEKLRPCWRRSALKREEAPLEEAADADLETGEGVLVGRTGVGACI